MNPAAPSVFHSEFGNFDQFLNSLENMQVSILTAHGIKLQNTEAEECGGV